VRNGWIKLHRSLLSNPNFKDPEWTAVWVFLLLTATHANEKRSVRFQGEPLQLGIGQVWTNKREISEATGVHISKVHRILVRMEIEQQIERQSDNKNSIITLLNWRAYQKSNDKSNDN